MQPPIFLKATIFAALLIGLTSRAALADAVDAAIGELQLSYSPPETTVCLGDQAFDARLSQPSNNSAVTIVERGVPWIGKATVTEFKPIRPYPPFTRFFYLETPVSHRISWALGAAFYETESLAQEAALKMAMWYAERLQLPLRDGYAEGMYLVKPKGLTLTVWARGKSVRVGCAHSATESDVIKEAMDVARSK